jgi:hypothetical protein
MYEFYCLSICGLYSFSLWVCIEVDDRTFIFIIICHVLFYYMNKKRNLYIEGRRKEISVLDKIVSSSKNENSINKRLGDYLYDATMKAKKINKETLRKFQPFIYGNSSLLDKIMTSNLNDNLLNQRLEQISYSAINGQRQEETTYIPEGVRMLGQMGREKPLTDITKQMIEEYQEEQNKPIMVDGEARIYMKPDYEPILKLPVNIEDYKDEMRVIYKKSSCYIKNTKRY